MKCYGCGERLGFIDVEKYRGEEYHKGCAVEVQHEDVRQVIAEIARAQVLLDSAAQKLSRIPGFAEEWAASAVSYNEVNTQWRLLSEKLASVEVAS